MFSRQVMSNSLWPHRVQHARLPCPSVSPGVCSNSSPLSQWCHLTLSSSIAPSPPFAFSLSQHQGLFQWVGFSHQVAKALELWSSSFSTSTSTEYSRLISFRIDWFNLAVQETLSPVPQFKKINSLALSLPYGPTLVSIHDYWRNQSFDSKDLYQQSDISAF